MVAAAILTVVAAAILAVVALLEGNNRKLSESQ
jgi:hypothetical protein